METQPNQSVQTIRKSPAYGGNGGSTFEDNVVGVTRIAAIVIRHGSVIDAISTIYDLGKGAGRFAPHGGSGGGEVVIVFEPGEQITGIEGHAGHLVDQLTIVTNVRKYGPYGDGGGAPFKISDKKIVAFFGRSGTRIDQIGVLYQE